MSNSRKRKYSEEFQSSWGAQSEPCCMPLWEYGRGQEPCCQSDDSCSSTGKCCPLPKPQFPPYPPFCPSHESEETFPGRPVEEAASARNSGNSFAPRSAEEVPFSPNTSEAPFSRRLLDDAFQPRRSEAQARQYSSETSFPAYPSEVSCLPPCPPKPPCPSPCPPEPPCPSPCPPEPPCPSPCPPEPPCPSPCPPEPPCPQPCPPEPPCPPPCSTQPEVPDFFAQYGVMSSPASGSNLAYLKIFNQGNKITLQENTVIVLPKGYLYQIDYLFLATPETNSYFQVVPYLNGSPRLLYAGWASSNSAFRNASTSGSFTTDEARNADALLSIRLTYPNTVRNIDISGAVSITPLQKL